MDQRALQELIDDLLCGRTAPDEAVRLLRALPFSPLGYATLDSHRELRQGLPEAVYGPGKTPEHCQGIVAALLEGSRGPVVLTRATAEQAAALAESCPPDLARGGTLVWRPRQPDRQHGEVVVVTAGTADLPVAEECLTTLEAVGLACRLVCDVGVAGLHRILAQVELLQSASGVVVVAGMEGALASVVGGLVASPVVAVPTSVGYGAGLEGVTALLGMLASCASGLCVVGIDNGFGAAIAMWRILGASRAGSRAKSESL